MTAVLFYKLRLVWVSAITVFCSDTCGTRVVLGLEWYRRSYESCSKTMVDVQCHGTPCKVMGHIVKGRGVSWDVVKCRGTWDI